MRKIWNFIKRKKQSFNLTQYTKRIVSLIIYFTMAICFLCIWRNNAKAYALAVAAINDLWKVGGLYMIKSLLETGLEKGSIGKGKKKAIKETDDNNTDLGGDI